MREEMAKVVMDEMQTQNIKACPGHEITHIESTGSRLKVECSDLILETDLVLVAVGVTPNSRLAVDIGLELSVQQSISVDRNLRSSDEHIYAAGDCSDAYHVVSGRKVWIPLALRANRAGWAVADNLCGKKTALEGVAGTAVFKVFDLQIARTGLTVQEAAACGFDPSSVLIKSRSRAHAHPMATDIWVEMIGDKVSGKLLGAIMVGREGVAHRINAAAVALHNKMSVEAFAQTDMAYAPPFGPVWDPLLTAANQLLKTL
jgi:pyruvate/2-oxoglutarate dehydrogenase complex dihydrolipoamide dehydrogenase (E3) component